MITVFCLCTYNLPIRHVEPAQDGLIVRTWEKGLFGLGTKISYIPTCINEGDDVEKLRAEAHETIDSHYDAVAKGQSA